MFKAKRCIVGKWVRVVVNSMQLIIPRFALTLYTPGASFYNG